VLGVVRRAVGLALLTAPLVSGYWLFVERVTGMGEALGRFLPQLSQPLPLGSSDPAESADGTQRLESLPEAAPGPSAAAPAVRPGQGSLLLHARGERVLMISDRTVLALVQAGKVPHATSVAARAGRPNGLELAQTSGLGIGVQDGDILFEVAGVPVSTQAAIADLVLAARTRHDGVITARLWRRGETIALVVGMPYLDRPSESQR
jgi:hypothetical protein